MNRKHDDIAIHQIPCGMMVSVDVRPGEGILDALARTVKHFEEQTASKYARPSDTAEFSPKCENVKAVRYDFCTAMRKLKSGARMAREGWNGSGMCLKAQFPDEHSKMTFPYLYMTIPGCAEGERRLPWQPAQVDLFSEDWVVLD